MARPRYPNLFALWLALLRSLSLAYVLICFGFLVKTTHEIKITKQYDPGAPYTALILAILVDAEIVFSVLFLKRHKRRPGNDLELFLDFAIVIILVVQLGYWATTEAGYHREKCGIQKDCSNNHDPTKLDYVPPKPSYFEYVLDCLLAGEIGIRILDFALTFVEGYRSKTDRVRRRAAESGDTAVNNSASASVVMTELPSGKV